MNRLPEHLHQKVIDNLGLVGKIARRMSVSLHDPSIDFDDLYSSGCIGLMFAVQYYDESQGAAFSSYAYRCIWGYAATAINRNAHVKVPNRIRSLANRIRISGLQETSSEELAAKFGVVVEHIDYAKHFLSAKQVPMLINVDGDVQNLADQYTFSAVDTSNVYVNEFVQSLPSTGKGRMRRELLELMLQGLKSSEAGERLGVTRQAAHFHLKGIREAWQQYQVSK